GTEIEQMINRAIENFNYEKPEEIFPELIDIYNRIQILDENHWKKIKSDELLKLIKSCLGIWTEAIADDFLTTPGGKLNITAGLVNRSKVQVKLIEINIDHQIKDSVINASLKAGEFTSVKRVIQLPDNENITQPYWLKNEHSENVYEITNQQLIGKAVNDFALNAEFKLSIDGTEIIFRTPVFYRETDPVKGELYRQIEIAPPVTINFEKELFVFSSDEPKKISVVLKNNGESSSGMVKLISGEDWKIIPGSYQVSFNKKNEEQSFSFTIYPPTEQSEAILNAQFLSNEKVYNRSYSSVSYDHISVQTYYPAAKAKLTKVLLGQKVVNRIGYIAGSGDKIPEYLNDLGFTVEILRVEILTNGSLNNFDVIISGIRAYNTNERANLYKEKLMKFVQDGGTYLVQYNTANNLQSETGPYPFTISRDRVTEEDAKIKILNPEHQLFNFPNKITDKDFEGWIQERGLYFAGTWDEKYLPMLEMNDKGESPTRGSLIYTEYGKGKYIYTGISFFRQLPAGVPGAYRLFINLISSGSNE
ncbi:MAG TPA: hypothetical protein VH917_06935, partial [Ignavibacteriaceae bacterium]